MSQQNLVTAAAPDQPMAGPAMMQQPAAPTSQKQRLNVYTVMLILAFIFMVTASIVFYLHLQEYGDYPWWNTSAAQGTTTSYLDGTLQETASHLSSIAHVAASQHIA